MKYEYQEHKKIPDTLIIYPDNADKCRDHLSIEVTKGKIHFMPNVDDCGNLFEIEVNEFVRLLSKLGDSNAKK